MDGALPPCASRRAAGRPGDCRCQQVQMTPGRSTPSPYPMEKRYMRVAPKTRRIGLKLCDLMFLASLITNL